MFLVYVYPQMKSEKVGIWLVNMLKIVGIYEEEDSVGGCSYKRVYV